MNLAMRYAPLFAPVPPHLDCSTHSYLAAQVERNSRDVTDYNDCIEHETLRVAIIGMMENPTTPGTLSRQTACACLEASTSLHGTLYLQIS